MTLFEARPRLGGRVVTARAAPLPDVPWLDLGPAWFWSHQRDIRTLVAHFGLEVFEQHRPGLAMYDAGDGRPPEPFDASAQSTPSFRVKGGMAALTDALYAASRAATQPPTIHLDAAVRAITLQHDGVVVEGPGVRCVARHVIVTAPPRVVMRDIAFDPPLSNAVRGVLADTVTWMGHAMKCVATYDTPFWRDSGRSGYAVSWAGPLQEIHDACMPPCDHPPAGYALMGFVAPRTSAAAQAFRDAGLGARRTAVLTQLARLFGTAALRAVDYAEYDWARDPLSCGPRDEIPPNAHPEYGHAFFDEAGGDAVWKGRLFWAGTETCRVGGGYLDGAVASGTRAARAVSSVGDAS